MRLTHRPERAIDDWQAFINRRALVRALPELSDPELEAFINALVERLTKKLLHFRKSEKTARNDAMTAVAAIFGGLDTEAIMRQKG